MVYNKQTWQNNPPSTATPITAERLDHLETQYDEAIAALEPEVLTLSEIINTGRLSEAEVDDTIASQVQPVADELAIQVGKVVHGTGMPNGVVTATPGTLYVDTVKTMGASIWRKDTGTGTSGWTVVEGDTGWRDITSLLVAGLTPSSSFGSALVRRMGDTVYGILKLDVSADASQIASLPAGFRGPKAFKYDASVFTAPSTGAGASLLARTHTGVLYMGTSSVWQTGVSTPWPNPGTVAWSPEHQTMDPWPTSLPGTPA